MPELIGDEFDRHAGISHQARCLVPKQVRRPVTFDAGRGNDLSELFADRRRIAALAILASNRNYQRSG